MLGGILPRGRRADPQRRGRGRCRIGSHRGLLTARQHRRVRLCRPRSSASTSESRSPGAISRAIPRPRPWPRTKAAKRRRPTPYTEANERRVLVVGGGIAGLNAALDAAAAGFDVVLVEREARLGGVT